MWCRDERKRWRWWWWWNSRQHPIILKAPRTSVSLSSCPNFLLRWSWNCQYTEHRFLPIFFSHWREAFLWLKSWNKNEGNYSRFAVELQKVRTTWVPWDFWARTGAFQNGMYLEGGRKHGKIRFYLILWNLQRGRAIRRRTKCNKDEALMSFRMVQHNIYNRRPRWG